MEYLNNIYNSKASRPKYALAGTITPPNTIEARKQQPIPRVVLNPSTKRLPNPYFSWDRQGNEAPTGVTPLEDIQAERAAKWNQVGKVGIEVGGQVASSIIDNNTTSSVKDAYGNEYTQQSVEGSMFSGAAKGASMGMAFGPYGAGAGAIIGGAYGAITANNQIKENRNTIKKVNKFKNDQSVVDATNLTEMNKASGFKSSGNIYPYGGKLANPEYEVEGNEVVQGQDTQLEGQEDLASDMTKAVGPTHAEGGVEGQGGERVFSDRLKPSEMLTSYLSANRISVKPNYTYATITEKLGKMKGKFEEKLDSHNPTNYRTGKVMTERIDGLIDAAFQDQELSKEQESVASKYPYGGKVDRKPIVVNNPNDPRLRAYNDSLYVHETSKDGARIAKVLDGKTLSKKTVADIMEKITPDDRKYEEAYYRAGYNHANPEYTQNFKGTYADSREHFGYEGQMSIMPRPVQPVVYQKPVAKPRVTNFEQRIQKPTQSIDNGDGTTSTHSMMSFESDGKYYAAPTVVEINGKLQRLSEDDAYNYAMKNKEYKEFKTDAEAKAYATNGYKKGTPLEHIPTKPTYTSQKQMYQGREFMETTGLRPDNYHPEEVKQAKQNQMKTGKKAFAKGGKINYPYGGKLSKAIQAADEFVTPEQAINAGVFLSNIKNANKQVTGVNRTTATPVYNRSTNISRKAIYDAKSTGRNVATTLKNSGSNLQDYYARLSDVSSNVMQATNDANQKQNEMDAAVRNQNVNISNAYRGRVAENSNADMLDRASGRNTIIANKQAAANAFIQGVSANAATKKAENVEMAKIELTNKLLGNRGIDDRLYEDMQKNPDKYKHLSKYLPKQAKGGMIKRKAKAYC